MTQNNEREALIEFKDAVKQLCKDFSSLRGNVYIKDVESSLDALYEQFIESPISQNEQQPKQIPDGWKLVLIEPDFNMKQAALEWNRRNTSGAFIKVAMEYHVAEKVYKAMINASPTNTEVGSRLSNSFRFN